MRQPLQEQSWHESMLRYLWETIAQWASMAMLGVQRRHGMQEDHSSPSLEVCWKVKGRTRRLSPVETGLATENRLLQFLPPPTVHFMRNRWSFEFGFLEHTFRGPHTLGNLNNQHQRLHSSIHRLNKCSLKVSTEIHWWAKPASGPAFVRSAVWGGEERQRSDDCPNQYEITIVTEGLWPTTAGYLLPLALHT